tara:strand:+ start:572 stop:901 length:330 start_codon:yes stop_codon:yes gene_type:complete
MPGSEKQNNMFKPSTGFIQKNNPFPVTSCGRRRKLGSPLFRTKPYTAGMTAAERKTYNNKTGGNVKGPQPEGGPRKDSYCARSAGIPKCKNPDKNGDCPNDIARRNWKC